MGLAQHLKKRGPGAQSLTQLTNSDEKELIIKIFKKLSSEVCFQRGEDDSPQQLFLEEERLLGVGGLARLLLKLQQCYFDGPKEADMSL